MDTVETPLICPITFGRVSQLAKLAGFVRGLREGHGATLLITGEAGIAKTRVVGEARALALTHPGARVLEGSAFQARPIPALRADYRPVSHLPRQ